MPIRIVPARIDTYAAAAAAAMVPRDPNAAESDGTGSPCDGRWRLTSEVLPRQFHQHHQHQQLQHRRSTVRLWWEDEQALQQRLEQAETEATAQDEHDDEETLQEERRRSPSASSLAERRRHRAMTPPTSLQALPGAIAAVARDTSPRPHIPYVLPTLWSRPVAQSTLFVFADKPVVLLSCLFCDSAVTARGMCARLLSNTSQELFSTDTAPASVSLTGSERCAPNCLCRIRDCACQSCGNTLGYHVVRPCSRCLHDCTNGHLWMFHGDNVKAESRLVPGQLVPLNWGALPPVAQDEVESQFSMHHQPVDMGNPCR